MAVGCAVAGTAQFTPRQVLEAGRRAEVDGKRDYAIQFYQHVLAHHGATAEASEADAALRRMTGTDSDAGYGTNGGYPLIAQVATNGAYAGQTNGHSALPPLAPAMAAPPMHPGHLLPLGPQRQSSRTAPPADTRHATAKTSRRPKHVERDDDDLHELPQRKLKRYRLGRFMAALIGFVGALAALASLIALGANLALVVTKPSGLLSMAAISPVFAGGMLGGACVLILLSQIAKATFDVARERSHR